MLLAIITVSIGFNAARDSRTAYESVDKFSKMVTTFLSAGIYSAIFAANLRSCLWATWIVIQLPNM